MPSRCTPVIQACICPIASQQPLTPPHITSPCQEETEADPSLRLGPEMKGNGMNEITAPGFDPRASLGRKHGKGVGRNMVQSLLASAFFEEKKKKKGCQRSQKNKQGKRRSH